MKDTLQWHPAFFAGLQIELEKESENLLFENEHQLGTKPKEIDVLIIKKDKDIPIKKNIGQIFRKYNMIEYKGPKDYISIDDYYKVYAYACFFKSDTRKVNSIPITEITVTFVNKRYPKKLFEHLKRELGYEIEEREKGIYLLHGNVFPIQIIVTKELSPKENLWLHSLTDDITDSGEAEELVYAYEKHRKNTLYESVMDIIVRANYHKFEEVGDMCEALIELMQPYINEQVEKRVKEQLEQQLKEQLEQQAEQEMIKGESRVNLLNNTLMQKGRKEDIFKAMANREYQKKLFIEFNI